MRTALTSAIALLTLAFPASAEVEISLYFGLQSVRESSADGNLPDGTPFDRDIDWKGRPFDAPIYYGGRVMWWNDNNFGFGIEGTHTKAIAPDDEAASIGLGRFELSDGHNVFTANVMRRWPDAFGGSNFTPYLGGGVGIAVPHVDATVLGASNRTFGFETTGFALRGIAGVKYDLTERWALFSEYQFTWSDNDITIDGDPLVPGQPDGELNTNLLTHALNFGVSLSF